MLREFVPEPAYSTTDEDTVFALLSRRAKRDPDDLIALLFGFRPTTPDARMGDDARRE